MKYSARLDLRVKPEIKKALTKKALKKKLSLADHSREVLENDLKQKD